MKLLRSGFDSLDVAFRGALASNQLNMLAKAREEAQETGEPVLVKIGAIMGHVADTGARGGYRYRFDTGPEGEIWFFKHNDKAGEWNIRVSVRAGSLLVNGYQNVKDGLYHTLEHMGASVWEESISRIDWAVDFWDDTGGFKLDPTHIVTSAWQVSRGIHHGEEEFDALGVHMIGRKVETVTVGKMPGRQIQIYDKRREVVKARGVKDFWWSAWGLTPEDQVWRVEVRFGKKYLKEKLNISTWEDLERILPDALAVALSEVRHTAPTDDSNVSRHPNSSLWDMVLSEAEDEFNPQGDLQPGMVLEADRRAKHEMYIKMIAGLVAGVAVTSDTLTPREAYRAARKSVLSVISNEKIWEAKLERVCSRYHFTDTARGRDQSIFRDDWATFHAGRKAPATAQIVQEPIWSL